MAVLKRGSYVMAEPVANTTHQDWQGVLAPKDTHRFFLIRVNGNRQVVIPEHIANAIGVESGDTLACVVENGVMKIAKPHK